jgi:hypothetical protein
LGGGGGARRLIGVRLGIANIINNS